MGDNVSSLETKMCQGRAAPQLALYEPPRRGMPCLLQLSSGKRPMTVARLLAGFPKSLFDRLATFGIGEVGQQVVDVGTGIGNVRHLTSPSVGAELWVLTPPRR